ncbi:MAG: RrF2 family transcriptional regulator [Panacagrimonas sp.]
MKSSLYGAAAEYALHSLLNLAARSEPVSVGELARYQGIPERYLAKIFTRLEKARIVGGSEGVSGGFALAVPAGKIRVLDILEAVDPGRTLFACAEIRRNCILFGEKPPDWSTNGMCQIHSFMKKAERELKNYLATKTLADLCEELERKAPREFVKESEIWFHQRKDARTTRRGEREHDHKGR